MKEADFRLLIKLIFKKDLILTLNMEALGVDGKEKNM